MRVDIEGVIRPILERYPSYDDKETKDYFKKEIGHAVVSYLDACRDKVLHTIAGAIQELDQKDVRADAVLLPASNEILFHNGSESALFGCKLSYSDKNDFECYVSSPSEFMGQFVRK
jgi:hypothetical protein